MQKNKRIIAIVIAILVSIAMIVPSFSLLFTANDDNVVTASQSLESRVESLKEALESNLEDVPTRTALANAYYDLGIASLDNNDKAVEYFNKAVAEYQEVRKDNNSIGVVVDMATAAFYGGQHDLAEKTYQEALEMQPDFLYALVNYGVFLLEAKGDYIGAIEQWNTALTKSNPTEDQKAQIQSFINYAQEALTNSGKPSTDNNSNTDSGAQETEAP